MTAEVPHRAARTDPRSKLHRKAHEERDLPKSVVRRGLSRVHYAFRRTPATLTYLGLLLTTYWIAHRMLPRDQLTHLLLSVSTTVPNLQHRPLTVLAGSAFFLAGPLVSIGGFSTTLVGIVGCMGCIERRCGSAVAIATFAAGHVGATWATTAVKLVAVSTRHYDRSVLYTLDYGVSFGTVAVMAAVLLFLPALVRPIWLAGGVWYLLSLATWSGSLPDFTTVGHLCALAIGLAIAPTLRRRHSLRFSGIRSPGVHASSAVGSEPSPEDKGPGGTSSASACGAENTLR